MLLKIRQFAHLGVVEGFYAEMIPGAEQPPPASVPDGEGKIAQEMLDALFSPDQVRVQDQFRVGSLFQVMAAVAA